MECSSTTTAEQPNATHSIFGQYAVTLYGQNLFNSNASTFTTASQWVEAQTIVRPRVLGLKLNYNFSGR